MNRLFGVAVPTLIGFAMFAGCDQLQGSKKDEKVLVGDSMEEKALEEVGTLYRAYLDEAKRPPRKVGDFAKDGPGYPFGYDWLVRGDLVAVWGTNLDEAAADAVLAYEKKAPEQGGFVLMQDGKTIKKMSAEEFKAAPKAKSSK